MDTTADAQNQSEWADLAVMDEDSGAVLVLAARRRRGRLALQRLMVFLADGVTLWYNADLGAADHTPELSWAATGRTHRVRLFAHTAEDLEPAEHLVSDPGPVSFRVPVTLDLTLSPLSLPVPRQRRFPDGGLTGSQTYRARASLAAGSVIYDVRGHAWVSHTRFSDRSTEKGARLQAAFQDGSSMLAAAPNAPGEPGPGALQQATDTAPVHVNTFRISGPARRIPMRVICQLDAERGGTILGGYRSLDQHIAFVEPRPESDGWLRRAYTPYDFARSGVTGFGILEQVTPVSTPDSPAVVGTGIPETF
ncbi:hypothetical protein [Microbacterium sp.]|uniref:hypothetical protein n=1 Tax=Microbacterium sp. TaxID=51671 RepID=UPI0037C69E49